jgi:hypothetical protein
MFVPKILQAVFLLAIAVIPASAIESATSVGISAEEFSEYKRAAQLSLTAFPKCSMPLGNKKLADIKGSATGYIAADNVRKQVIVRFNFITKKHF